MPTDVRSHDTGSGMHPAVQCSARGALIAGITAIALWLSFSMAGAASAPTPLQQGTENTLAPRTTGSAGTSFVECEWIVQHGDFAYYWLDGVGENHTDRFMRFEPAVICTLKSARVMVYGLGCVGTPTLRVRIYGPWQVHSSTDPQGRLIPDCDSCPPESGTNFLTSIDVPWDDLETTGNWTEVDLTNQPGWPNDYIFGPLSGPFFVTASLSPATPAPATDKLALVIDDGYGDGHSGAFLDGQYRYYDVTYGRDYGSLIEAYVCYEETPPPPCDADDDWNTWAHDYQRTGRSHIAIGDPCEVTAVWTANLPDFISFCEPTIAGDWVYVASEFRQFAFDLTTGTQGPGTIAGIPYVFDQDRGNATIEGGYVYVTGGSGQAISQWNPDLTSAYWVNGIGAGHLLGATCRFAVTAVYDIGVTEVVTVGTEGGHLWCFETATGNSYPGWPTNPVILDEGIYHSPAYDGDDLYIGTSDDNYEEGAIYRIDAATGAIVWRATSSYPHEGYPGGVSLDEAYVYAASSNDIQGGHRVKFDKDGNLEWEFPEARCLYGAPAFGRYFLFIPQDVDGGGVLVVDPFTGYAHYNYAVDGVGRVTQGVTTTCDGYALAGERYGRWWLLSEDDFTAEWKLQFDGIVNGTALATDSNGDNYAVVSVRSGNPIDSKGYVVAAKLNAGARPRVRQNVFTTDILVPFNAGTADPYTEPNVLENIGCANLTITHSVSDPAPDPVVQAYTTARSQYAASLADVIVGDDFTAYFADTKQARLRSGPRQLIDQELTRGDRQLQETARQLATSRRANRRLAASAATLRTSSVTYTHLLYPGQSTDVSWIYDGTGLGRETDVEQIEFVTNDPDYLVVGHTPTLQINYSGGCPTETTELYFNSLATESSERISNMGNLGSYYSDDELVWQGFAGSIFDGSFVLCGDSIGGTLQDDALFFGAFYEETYLHHWHGTFMPNPIPSSAACGLESGADVRLGYRHTGGCPGTPVAIYGDWVRAFYADTNRALPPDHHNASVDVNITQTEVGAYDPLYGDFKVIRWELQNRDGVNKDLYGGTWMDWDIGPDAYDNTGLYSDLFNGYVIWNATVPELGFGMLDPRLPTDYSTVDATAYPVRTIFVEDLRTYDGGPFEPYYDPYSAGGLWHRCVNPSPLRQVMTPYYGGSTADYAGILTNQMVSLPGNGTAAVHQVLFGVDASSGNQATIEANALSLAERAARWAGFARGDVNEDGKVDVQDVCWLLSGYQIYPDAYNGDVDLSGTVDTADQVYLLDYVTGIGAAPLGAWRFTF